MDYGSIVYGNAFKNILKPLDNIQNKAAQIAIEALHSTPINALMAETHIMPLHLRRKNLSYRFTLSQLNRKSPIPIVELTTNVLTSNYWNHKQNPLIVDSFLYISSSI